MTKPNAVAKTSGDVLSPLPTLTATGDALSPLPTLTATGDALSPLLTLTATGNVLSATPAVAAKATGDVLSAPPAVAAKVTGNVLSAPPAVAAKATGEVLSAPPAVAAKATGEVLSVPPAVAETALVKGLASQPTVEQSAAPAAELPPILGLLINFFSNIFVEFSIAGSPASDAFQTGGDGLDYIIGREGNDVFLAVDPGKELPGKGEVDIFSAGDGKDRFIIGDWRNAYYDDGDPLTIGDGDFALILDFNPSEDTIQLHGTSSDYLLVEDNGKTAILLKGSQNNELIAKLPGTELDLNANYFRYESEQPGEAVQPLVEQIGTTGQDIGFSIANASDGSGALYVTGYTTGDLGGTDAGSLEAFLIKYDSNGAKEWSKHIGSNANENGYGVTTDESGNVYWLARTNGDVAGQNAGIGNDVLIYKFDSDGNELWSKQFGSFGLDNAFVNPQTDGDGNVYLAGYTNGDLFSQNAGTGVPAGTDCWVRKLDSDGNELWAQQFGSTGGEFDETFGLALDSEGSAYTTGWTLGDLGGPNNIGSDGKTTYDIWLNKFDSEGNREWTKQIGTDTFDWSWDVAVSPTDDIYIAGWTLGDLGGPNAGSYDFWVAKYDTGGNQQWLKQFGTPGDDSATGIAIDAAGDFYLTGYTNYDPLLGIEADYEAWVGKFDSEGNPIWSRELGTPDYEHSYGISVKDGSIYLTGLTDGSFGSRNQGSWDAWIAKLSSDDGALLDFNNPSFNSQSVLPDFSFSDVTAI